MPVFPLYFYWGENFLTEILRAMAAAAGPHPPPTGRGPEILAEDIEDHWEEWSLVMVGHFSAPTPSVPIRDVVC